MKLTQKQVVERMTAAWGRQAVVVPSRICGNRTVYAVTDHNGNWWPLETSWSGGRQVFEPVDRPWPQDPWSAAVAEAAGRARAYFYEQQNWLALRRLPRGQAIALSQKWSRAGDDLDTWYIQSQSKGGTIYEVNGRCTCLDYLVNGVPGGWCKHRIARALAIRAEEIIENGAGSNADSTAPNVGPKGTNTHSQDSTASGNGQAQRIELIVGYTADEARSLARVNANGKLIWFLADGVAAEPPALTTSELYRWLQEHGYIPDDFKWLGWGDGLRQRRQTYVLTNGSDQKSSWAARLVRRIVS